MVVIGKSGHGFPLRTHGLYQVGAIINVDVGSNAGDFAVGDGIVLDHVGRASPFVTTIPNGRGLAICQQSKNTRWQRTCALVKRLIYFPRIVKPSILAKS